MKEKLLKYTCYTMVAAFIITITLLIVLSLNGVGTVFTYNPISDFIETIVYCIVKNPYDGNSYNIHAIYPPFAYLLFMPFALICKKDLLYGLNDSVIGAEGMYSDAFFSYAVSKPSVIVAFVLFFAITLALVLLLAWRITSYRGKNLFYLFGIIISFGPFIYMCGRGNIIFLSLVFMMVFYKYYNSDKWYIRELALLSLGAAVAMKIYPAIMIFFLLKDHKWKEMLRALLYSVILIFLPFALTSGGFKNISQIWNNFTNFNSGEGRDENWSNISSDALASKVALLLGVMTGQGKIDIVHSLLSKLLRFGLLILDIVVLALSKKSKNRFAAFTLALLTYSLFQGVSYCYTLIYLVISIIIFFDDFDEYNTRQKYMYGICLALIVIPFFYIAKFFLVQSIVAHVLVITCIVDLLKEFVSNRKEAKKQVITENN